MLGVDITKFICSSVEAVAVDLLVFTMVHIWMIPSFTQIQDIYYIFRRFVNHASQYIYLSI